MRVDGFTVEETAVGIGFMRLRASQLSRLRCLAAATAKKAFCA